MNFQHTFQGVMFLICFCCYSCKKESIVMLTKRNAEIANQWIFEQQKDLNKLKPTNRKYLKMASHGVELEFEFKGGISIAGFEHETNSTQEKNNDFVKSGRCYLYDQAIAAIAVLMYENDAQQAHAILKGVLNFQNPDGSFGFSWDTYNKEGKNGNFCDFKYIRTGANAWIGYAMTFYQNFTSDDAFLTPTMKLAAWLNREIHPQYGLIKGGFGRYVGNNFIAETQNWMSTEHNIDAWFFISELAIITENSDYKKFAKQLKNKILKFLWNDKAGRFNQGLNYNGEIDNARVLDVNSWGAMFLRACGESEKAKRALLYAEKVFNNSIRYENTRFYGYKPYVGYSKYHGINWTWRKFIWTEGSLGMAMAYLKIGDNQKAEEILHNMAKIQMFFNDRSKGSINYSLYNGNEIKDFSRLSSVGGTAWFLMVWSAFKKPKMCNMFWQ